MSAHSEIVGSRWSWLKVDVSGPDEEGWITFTTTPKRLYWLHPSFWVMVVRSSSLMPTAADTEIEITIEIEDDA